MKIELVDINTLQPYERNARTHSEKQIEQIANSIKEFGFTNPILIDKNNMVAAGHGRLLAAKKLNLEKVPVVRLSKLTETQIRAYILADNKLAENAGWDTELLNSELEELTAIDFDITLLGFDSLGGDVVEFKPNLPDEDEEIKQPEIKLTLTVMFNNEGDQKELFDELRDRGFKVKI